MSEKEPMAFKVVIDATLDQVWHELVKTDGLQKPMFDSRLHTDGVRPGGQLRMRSANGKFTAVVGEYLEVERPVRLSHTFRFTSYDDPECTVVYELKEVDGGVELALIVEAVPAGTKTEKQMGRGGSFIVKTMKAVVENGRPPLGTRLLFRLFRLLEPLNPKRCRSENWPLQPRGAES